MKIAVASDNNQVTQHFGHCQSFQVYHFEDSVLKKEELVPNPGHRPGFLPNYLSDLRIDVIISGGMGGGAVDLFHQNNIEVVIGAQGNSMQAAKDFVSGKLKSTGSICNDHAHHDECH